MNEFRKGDYEFDRSIVAVIRKARPMFVKDRECNAEASKPRLSFTPKEVSREDILVMLARASLRLNPAGISGPEADLSLSKAESIYLQSIVDVAHDMIDEHQKERRRLLSENNQLRMNIHTLRKGGTPVVHASNQSSV